MANALLYGFAQLKDIDMSDLATTVDRSLLISAVETSREIHNQEVNAFLGLFTQRTTVPQIRFQGGGLSRSQPLDENGRPLPIKPPVPYTVGFPIWSSGNAWGANYVTSKKLTVQDVNDRIGMMFHGDLIWLRDQLLGLLFRNTSMTFTDPMYGAVTVQGLANGDTVRYVSTTGASAIDTHYSAQANAIADADNPYDDIYAELAEHPGNGTNIISFINSAQAAGTLGLTNFIDVLDPDIVVGNASNTLRRDGPPGVTLPGSAKVLGKTDGVWVVDWTAAIPSGYIVSLAVGSNTKPVMMREDPEPELQGFRAAGERNDFPYFEDIWFRRAGFGAYNRVAAHVHRVGNASYAVPVGWTIPMP